MKKRALMHIDKALELLNLNTKVGEHLAAGHLSIASMMLIRPMMGFPPYASYCRKSGIPIINWATDEWEES